MVTEPSTNAECVFCSIVADPSRDHVVWEDADVLAFMDINPVTDGHLLVVPKEHTVGLTDMPPALAGKVMQVAQELARALRASEVRCEGVNLFFAEGEAALQEIFHSHLHVFPRYPDDGFEISADWAGSTDDRLSHAADQVRAGLERIRSSAH
ncbi:HIT family protein [Demequina globuliformis]|uniref:HIT family protein n=1 Tax=Demequina globuliformis TaxID=676202 RepID=UPI000782CBAE|nr:HIT domain-containing protein [Demequina globuliformis]